MKNFELKNYFVKASKTALDHLWNFRWLFQPISIFETKEDDENQVRRTKEMTVLNIDKEWTWFLTYDLVFWLRACDVMQDFLQRWEKFDLKVITPEWENKTLSIDKDRLVISNIEIEETAKSIEEEFKETLKKKTF